MKKPKPFKFYNLAYKKNDTNTGDDLSRTLKPEDGLRYAFFIIQWTYWAMWKKYGKDWNRRYDMHDKCLKK